MTQREIYIGCLQSFFRNRHGTKQRFKKSKNNREISVHADSRRMVRYYIKKIRELDAANPRP